MRLVKYEIDSINNNFYIIFNKVRVLLFRSRLDDSFKGGDIDLYLETLNRGNPYKKVYFHHLILFFEIINKECTK